MRYMDAINEMSGNSSKLIIDVAIVADLFESKDTAPAIRELAAVEDFSIKFYSRKDWIKIDESDQVIPNLVYFFIDIEKEHYETFMYVGTLMEKYKDSLIIVGTGHPGVSGLYRKMLDKYKCWSTDEEYICDSIRAQMKNNDPKQRYIEALEECYLQKRYKNYSEMSTTDKSKVTMAMYIKYSQMDHKAQWAYYIADLVKYILNGKSD